MHWGYAASQRAAGRLVPHWGDDDIDARLHALLDHYAPRTVIIAGDVVHAAAGAAAAYASLERLAARTCVVLVTGNHDRRTSFTNAVPAYQEAAFFIHHGDANPRIPNGALEIIGHHHPAATWQDGAGTYLKLPALVEGPRRLILPAFSPWAAGVPWNHRLARDERLWCIAPNRIFPDPVPAAAGS